jgi:hypothetical protein
MAPDPSAANAGRKLAKPGPWKGLGRSERAFWGECQGSALYQTQVAVLDRATKCTCPSRKFPCKHALGLLFLMAESESHFPPGEEPEWVNGWLAKRGVAQQKKQARAEQEPKPVDVEAQAKRASKRQANVLAGIEQLELFLSDVVRRGLGRLPAEGPEPWDAQARRLVDAQAPGLASRVRSIGYRVGVADDWTERVLGDLGRLALLTRAYRRLSELPSDLAHDVRRYVGFTLDQAEVLEHGDVAEDEWIVASSTVTDDERLSLQRSWLVGRESARRALSVQVAVGTSRFQDVLVPGTAFRAKLAFWPGARPERALIAERLTATLNGRVPPHAGSILALVDDYATALSRDPWVGRTLALLGGVRVMRESASRFSVVDSAGQSLGLRGDAHEVLWAVSGGHPILLVAEWNGFELDALAAYDDGRCVPLSAGFEGAA